MPENNNSVFTEMLEVQLDLGKFQNSLNDALQAWNKFKSEVGAKNTGDLLKAGNFAGLKSEISQLAKTLDDIVTSTQQTQSSIVEILSKSVTEQVTLEKKKNKEIVSEAEKTAALQASLTEKVSEARAAQLKSKLDAPDGSLVQLNAGEKKALEIRLESEGEAQAALEKIRLAGIAADKANAIEAFKDVAKQKEAIVKRGEYVDDQASIRRAEVLARDRSAQLNALKDENQQRVENAQTSRKLDDDAAARRKALAVQDAGDQSAESRQQGESDAKLSTLQKLKGQLDQLFNKGAQGDFKQSLLLAPNDEARFKVIREELERVRALAAQVRSEVAGIGTGASGNADNPVRRVELQRQLNGLRSQETQALTEQHRLQNRVAVEQQKSAGFIAQQVSAIPKTIALVVRYAVAWQAVALATQAASLAITAPFNAIANGLKYLRETERAGDDLVGVLASNATFAKGYAANFAIAKASAVEVTKALQEQAALLGKNADTLEGTFKGMMSAGALRYVKSLKEVVELTTLFQLGLDASALGSLNIGNAVQKINDLFNGTVSNSDPFFKAFDLTKTSFDAILKSSEKTRDLLPQLAEKVKPFRDALLEAGKGQAVLLKSFDLLSQRIEGIAVKELFEKINSGLIKVNRLLTENQDKLASYLKLLADGIIRVADSLDKLAVAFKAFEGVVLIFHTILVLLEGIKAAFVTISALAVLSVETFAGITSLSEAGKKSWEEFGKTLVGVKDDFLKLLRVMGGGGIVGDDKGKKLLENEIKPGKDNPKVDGQTALLQAQLNKELAALDRQIGNIERKYQELGDATRLSLADRTLSYADAAKQIRSATDVEVAELEAVQAKRLAAIKKIEAAINADVGANPKTSAAAAVNLQAKLLREGESFEDKKRALYKRSNDALREANQEALSIEKNNIQARRAVRAQNAQATIALENELLAQGFSSATTSFDRIAAQEDALNKIRAETQAEDITRFAKGTVDYNKAIDEKNLSDQTYTDAVKLRSVKRVEVARTENAFIAQQLLEQKRIANDLTQAQVDLLQATLPTLDLSAQYENIVKARKAELEATIKQVEAQLALAKAKSLESRETIQLTTDLQALEVQRTQLIIQQIAAATQNVSNPVFGALITRRVRREAAEEEDRRRAKAAAEGGTFTASVKAPAATGKDVAKGALSEVLGSGFVDAFNSANGAVEKFGAVVGLVANALTSITRLMGAFKQGKEEGGLLGGLGAVASQFGAIPVVGPYIAAAGQILSFVGKMITNSARKMAEDIKKSFQKTMDSFQKGDATLADTITSLETARINAIRALSGKKGGKTELDKLLPDIEAQIDSLKRQQKELITSFDDQLETLMLQSSQLEQVKNQWQAINKQVKEYLNAGGDSTKAAQFLSIQLGKIRQQAVESLDSAEQDAIKSVLQLNDLLVQRNRLVDDFKKKEFDLQTQGSIERRQAGSVLRGRELAELRSQHDEQLSQLDREIRGVQTKVDKEREIFNLTNDTVALRRRDEALTLQALDAQIQKLRDLQAIVNGITQGGSGAFTGAGQLFNIAQVSINVTGVSGNPDEIGRLAVDGFTSELNRRSRMGT